MGNNNASGSGTLPSNTIINPRCEARAITTRSGLSYTPVPPIPPPLFDENESLTEKETEVTKDKVLPLPMHQKTSASALLSNKEKLLEAANTPLTENCSAVIMKKLPEKLGDPGRFLIPCDFTKMSKCMALADLGASINLMPLGIYQKLKLPELVTTKMTSELAMDHYPFQLGIAEDVLLKFGHFSIPADFSSRLMSQLRVPLIHGRGLLRDRRSF
ncbi:reverse transcriptase domain-containing protein [Tanacetum coccineum]